MRETNVARTAMGRPKNSSIYCNAHARRRFKEAADAFPVEGMELRRQMLP